jgi:uncharacterized protein with PIN domain
MTEPIQPRFAADRMLGRLARMLRLLGFDTVYARDITPTRLLEAARLEARIVLTRGDAQKRFPGAENVLSLESEDPPLQLREVVRRFKLDTRGGLWTRCTLCNGMIEKVEKQQVKLRLDPRVFRLYEQFFRCTGCDHIYWRGSHVERIVKNLASLLREPAGE